jgi:F-type H+-transporting ATPase subunit a
VTSASDPIGTLGDAADPAPKKSNTLRRILLLTAALIVVNIAAFFIVPPVDHLTGSTDCPYPVCFIDGNLHLPAPHVVWTPDGGEGASGLLIADVSLTDSLVTLFIITIFLLVGMFLLSRGRAERPGKVQNAVEWAYESLEGFASSMGGAAAKPYVPIFAAFFILILACNWSGFLPVVGRIPGLRAPTSDLNVTVGFALVAFLAFHIEGVRRLGLGGYLSKFFPLYEFKANGFGSGLIAMFVGLVELLLELVKPLTLSMRLFGNIYGGETALAVITALTITILPVGLFGLEAMLTTVQALIFSTLTLMFLIAAVESHHHEEGEDGHEGAQALHDAAHTARAAAAH